MSPELQFQSSRVLEANPQLTQRELSKSLGVILGGVNYCLKAMIAKESIKLQNFKNPKIKWLCAYFLTPQAWLRKQLSKEYF